MQRNTSVRLGEHFNGFVEDKIQQGRFEPTSEAIRVGQREMKLTRPTNKKTPQF